MKTGSMDERRLLADVRSGREALQRIANALEGASGAEEARTRVQGLFLAMILEPGAPGNLPGRIERAVALVSQGGAPEGVAQTRVWARSLAERLVP